jgi:hypothetical protein
MIDQHSLEYRQIIDKLSDNYHRQAINAFSNKLIDASVPFSDFILHVMGAYIVHRCIFLKKTCEGSGGEPLTTLGIFDLFAAKMRNCLVMNAERMKNEAH